MTMLPQEALLQAVVADPTATQTERSMHRIRGGWLFSKARHLALLGCAALLFPSGCHGGKAAYSLDLIGIKSGTAYTVVVDVGTTDSSNSFRLIADTGSSNDAILGAGCCGADAAVTYSCEDSSTCPATSSAVSIEFAGATIAGSYVTDTWSSSEFGSITKEFLVINEQDTFYRSEYDGITGLGYKALAKPKDAPKSSFYENLVASKSGTLDTLGLLLCGVMQPMLTQSNYSMHAGQMLVGGTDSPAGKAFYKEPIMYTPIAQESWYVVVVSDIGFDGKSLGLPCASYNEPQAIIDSGTSNIAFPSDVYNALMTVIKAATKSAVPEFSDAFFDYRKSCCGKDYCDPSDAALALLTLPSIYITLALQEDDSSGTTSHYTVEIPPEYYFRPEMNGDNSDVPCRAIGVAESTAIVLGDVFMDGLFAYHDRVNNKLGLAVADNCPNGVTSTKKVTKTTSKTDDWCDCFSSTLKSKSTLARYVPWGSGCFFMPWWLYVVGASVFVVLICISVLGYWYWTGRRDKRAATAPAAVSAAPYAVERDDVNFTRAPANRRGSSKPASRHQQPHPRDISRDYSTMSSPREMVDSGASSIALLTSSEDFSRGARRQGDANAGVSTQQNQQQQVYYQQEQQEQHQQQQQRRAPSHKQSNTSQRSDSGASTSRETSGFLL